MAVTDPVYVSSADLDIRQFVAICEQSTRIDDYPFAAAVKKEIVIYERPRLLRAMATDRLLVMSEINRLLRAGPGVLAIRGAYERTSTIDAVTEVFEGIIAKEAATGVASDHFAKAGANSRIWNSLQKVALRSPEAFIDYYANPLIDLVAEACLGPGYQVTCQVNVVRPGADAQRPHRDYHLGFLSDEEVARYPLPLQVLSQSLTLQGAIAHTDMPVETGPTLVLPYSQQYAPGYMAYRRPDFVAYFKERAVQLPLGKGDMLFFNPALFHAAGSNRTKDRHRIASLLQMFTAFAIPMETVDRTAMALAVYPVLLARLGAGSMDAARMEAVVATVAPGYSFPTNLDSDPPLYGMAPKTGQQLMLEALRERWPPEEFRARLDEAAARRKA
ncbi:MAG: phytanoyl-CoA dioxygenase family protein [Acetobacteraceae bacterium]